MQVAWVAEHGDLPLDQADAVLTVEEEYMVGDRHLETARRRRS
jgi:hypothetical protein